MAIQVVLRPELEALVNERVQSGRYATAEAVIEDALQLLKKRDEAEDHLETLLEEAEASSLTELSDEDWAEIEREGLARLRGQKPT